MDHSKKWKIKSDYPRGISAEIFNSEKLFYNEKKFNSKIFQSPTWFFFNKLFNAKIKKFKSFGIYKKLGMTNSFTVDNPKDYINVVNFIKKNKCSPGMNNIYNSFL